jgi:hypothetical protein
MVFPDKSASAGLQSAWKFNRLNFGKDASRTTVITRLPETTSQAPQ